MYCCNESTTGGDATTKRGSRRAAVIASDLIKYNDGASAQRNVPLNMKTSSSLTYHASPRLQQRKVKAQALSNTSSTAPSASASASASAIRKARKFQKRRFVNNIATATYITSSFALIAVMLSSSTNAFIMPAGKTFATSSAATIKTTSSTCDLLFEKVVDDDDATILDDLASSSTTTVATTATEVSYYSSSSSSSTSSSSSSSTSLAAEDENQFSLRNVLNIPNTPYNPTAEELLHRFPKIVGHRGCLYEELENTREGFARCHEMGCDGVELDVFKVRRSRRTSNNVNENNNNNDNDNDNDNDTTLIVFHGGGTDENPGDLLDYCGIDGSILDYNYETEIREKLTFNPDYAEFPCPAEKIRNGEIPTLEEVLLDAKHKNNNNFHRRMQIKIELKGPDVVKDVLELVDSLGVADMCSYSSFDLQKLKLVRQLKPDRNPLTGDYFYKTGALFNNVDSDGRIRDQYPPSLDYDLYGSDIIDRAVAVGASEIHLKYDTCSRPLIERIHAAGMGSMAWFRGPIGMNEDCSTKYFDVGNNNEEDLAMYEALIQTGVQELCVNKPDVLIELRNNLFLQSQQQKKRRRQQLLLEKGEVLV